MNKLFLFILGGIFFTALLGYFLNVLYFPGDILNLFPLFHTSYSGIPHNTLVSDPMTQFEPWRYFAKQQILQGQFPLWNNLNGNGVPFFANGQSAVLFPLNFLYYFLPNTISLNLIPLLKIFFLFLFSYLYLKSIKLSAHSSLAGSIAISFSGFSLVWLLWPHTNVFMFFPLFLYITEKLRNEKESKTHRWYILLSVSYCFAVFGGHPETLFHVFIIHWIYILFRIGFHSKILAKIAGFITIGFFLAGVQLFPLFEYLLSSYAFAYRVSDPSLNLAPIGFVINLIPFILGAPHLDFYKPIADSTNFQESIGGYTGLIVMITAFVSSFVLFKKNTLVKFWTVASISLLLLAYNIWPFGLLLELPLLRQSANGRLIAFAAFGVCVLFAIFIESRHEYFKQYFKKINLFLKSFIIVILLALLLLIYFINFNQNPLLNHPFILLLKIHIVFIIISTTIFFVSLYLFLKYNKKFLSYLAIVIFVGLQELVILGNYIPLISVKEYYPANNLIKKIKNIQGARILEIGNPSLLPNINLMYGISHAESYDALDIKNYREIFDKTFPDKNHWDNVDRVDDIENLKKFGISYLLTDYNPNFLIQSIQSDYDFLLGPLTTNKSLKISFTAKQEILSEIRLLPANYNRKNSCKILVSISDFETNENIVSRNIKCDEFLDKMFYTLELKNLYVIPGKRYNLTIQSPDATLGNSIAFWGNKQNQPYLSVFYNTNNKQIYEFIGEENRVQLWKVPEVSDIDLTGLYKIININALEILFEYSTTVATQAEIKIPYYPGWHASVDGKPTEIFNNSPFIKIKIPNGNHVVKLTYMPLSFVVGIVVSLFATVFITIFFMRKEKKQKWVHNFLIQWKKWSEGKKNIALWKHAFVIILGLIISSAIYLLLLNFLRPTFSMPWTTAINWYTVHFYPRQQDYYYFITGFLTISCVSVFIWLIWIWKKDK